MKNNSIAHSHSTSLTIMAFLIGDWGSWTNWNQSRWSWSLNSRILTSGWKESALWLETPSNEFRGSSMSLADSLKNIHRAGAPANSSCKPLLTKIYNQIKLLSSPRSSFCKRINSSNNSHLFSLLTILTVRVEQAQTIWWCVDDS